MGLMYPRIGIVRPGRLDRATTQGRNTAAMSISDAVGGATAISLTGLVFTAVGHGGRAGAVRRGVRADHARWPLLGVLVSRRTRPAV